MNSFAKRIRELRIEHKLTQKELAHNLNVLARTISYWEQGRQECDFSTLIKIAKYFNVSIDFLLGLSDY